MTTPYSTPQSSLNSKDSDELVLKRRKFWRRAIWITIGVIFLLPLLGLVGTTLGVLNAFQEVSETGKANPEALADEIATSIMTTVWEFIISLVVFLPILAGIIIRFLTLPKVE